jgi:hypothetical protein
MNYYIVECKGTNDREWSYSGEVLSKSGGGAIRIIRPKAAR